MAGSLGLRHDTFGGKTRTGSSMNTWQWMGARWTSCKETLFMSDCDLCHIIGPGHMKEDISQIIFRVGVFRLAHYLIVLTILKSTK